jgi:internalin A
MFKLKSKKLITLISFSLALIICSCTSNVLSTSASEYIHEIEQKFDVEKADSINYFYGNFKMYEDPVYMTVFDENRKNTADNLANRIINSIKNNEYKTFSATESALENPSFLEKPYFDYLKNMFDNSTIELFATMHLNGYDEGESLSSEYSSYFYNRGFQHENESYNYLYTVEKDSTTHTFVISLVLDDSEGSDIIVLKALTDGYQKIASKNYDDWLKDAVVLCQQRKYIPAIMRVRMAMKLIHTGDFFKPKYGSMFSDLFDYLNSKARNTITVSTPEDEFEIVYIKPEYWKNEQNFGYAIYYKSKLNFFDSNSKNIENEAKSIHEKMISDNILDSVGHYSYVPLFSDEKPKEVYNQNKAVFFEFEENALPIDYSDSYVYFGQAFEHDDRASEMFTDIEFEKYICSLVNKTPVTITIADLESITSLDLSEVTHSIYSLKGISKLSNLEYLDTGYASTYSLDEIGQLHKLKYLKLRPAVNTDSLSDLKDLKNLETLDMNYSYIDDIDAIANFEKLKTLNIMTFRDIDTSAIASLKHLENLMIDGEKEKIKSLAPIKEQLKHLEIEGLKYDLIDFPNLETLRITRIKGKIDLDIISGSKLKSLTIEHCNDLAPIFLEDFSNIEYLVLSNCNLENIDFLENSKLLTYLDLSVNDLVDLDGIEHLENLEHLDVSVNDLTDVDALQELENLKYLDIPGNDLTTLDGLNSLENLEELNASNNNLTNIDAISPLKNLKVLNVRLNEKLKDSPLLKSLSERIEVEMP